jgi:hypothetical protein
MTSSSNVLFPREVKKQIEIQMSGTLYGIYLDEFLSSFIKNTGRLGSGTDRLSLASDPRTG